MTKNYNKLQDQTVTSQTLSLLKSIQFNSNFDQFYLAGGTALSLLLGHRKSIDLDFFSGTEFYTNLLSHLDYDYKALNVFDNSIEIFCENTKIFFFRFAFPLKYKLINIENCRLADPRDIGMMKLLALQGRTTRKDIVDLYFIHKNVISLDNLIDLFENHYPKDKFNSYSSFKTLLDKSVLDNQPMPNMLKDCEWTEAYDSVAGELMRAIIN